VLRRTLWTNIYAYKNDRSARSRGSSRREFHGRTIRGGASLAATTVLGNELRSPENQAESQNDDLTRNPSSDASATTADLLAEKLAEWGVSVRLFRWVANAICVRLRAIRSGAVCIPGGNVYDSRHTLRAGSAGRFPAAGDLGAIRLKVRKSLKTCVKRNISLVA
jgi:hypothetical protein